MINRKGAIEFSMGFIISLLLGVVMLGLGLVFAYRIVAGVDEIKASGLPDTFDLIAKDCISRGDKMCVPEIRKTITSTKIESFGVVINNIQGEPHRFKPFVKFSKGIRDDGVDVTSIDISKWTFTEFKEVALDNNRNNIVEVPIRVPGGTKEGVYVFNVNVCYDSNANVDSSKCPESAYPSLYSPTVQLTVTVP